VLKRIAFLTRLDPQDPRYPRSRGYAVVRWIARLWFIPLSAYVGNLMMNLAMFVVHSGGTGFTLDSLGKHVRNTDAIVASVARIPLLAPALVTVIALLAFAGRQVFVDAQREAMVLRLREMWRVVERRVQRAGSAQTLRSEVAMLEREILSLLTLFSEPLADQPSMNSMPEAVRHRIAGISQRSDELARDVDTQAMIDAMAEQQMTAWQREQRVFMLIVGVTTLLAGFFVPLLTAV
jgi:hypothetical protein